MSKDEAKKTAEEVGKRDKSELKKRMHQEIASIIVRHVKRGEFSCRIDAPLPRPWFYEEVLDDEINLLVKRGYNVEKIGKSCDIHISWDN